MNTKLETPRRHRVAIVGCGFGGLYESRASDNVGVE